MQHETKPESAGAKRTLAGSAVGYGIVCGLTFPLMISSTFLQEMSLSHGAGDAFGALFFLAYALTMAGTALAHALRRKPTRRARIVSERKIVIGDVTLDYDSFTVRRGDEVQELPQKEFLLLYKLLSYPGKLFTRIQLMDELWGAESDSGWETVTVHLGRLRRRFADWDEFEIVAVRGLGYKAVRNV